MSDQKECSILDVPDQILLKIILYLNARERVALTKSANKFRALVFKEKKSLRELDFSDDAHLSTPSDVIEYFNNGKYEEIQKINIGNIYCTSPAVMLSHIAKAVNLVEINMAGIVFESFKQYTKLLEPLKSLKKLTSTWPTGPKNNHCNKILRDTLRRLSHLTLTLCNPDDNMRLLHEIEVCEKLEELRVVQAYVHGDNKGRMWLEPPGQLNKLRLVVCCGSDTPLIDVVVSDMLPDPHQWTRFPLPEYGNVLYIHYEKNVQVSDEISGNVSRSSYPRPRARVSLGQDFHFKPLLREVVRISNRTPSDEFCCLIKGYCCYSYLPRRRDVQLLLKNPRAQISYLNVVHNIEAKCDIHLVALAFPNLTTLVLSNVVRDKPLEPREKTPLKVCLKRKRSTDQDSDAVPESSSSFKKLVENTPSLKNLTICPRRIYNSMGSPKTWDLSALDLIAGWKNLTSLFLADLSIKNGQFLVEIGKQCKNLEKLRLENLGSRANWCYKKILPQILAHCHNLKDFSIEQDNLGQVSDLFDTLLAESPKLRRIRVKSLGKKNTFDRMDLSIQELTRSRKLTLLVSEIEGLTDADCDRLKKKLQKLKDELDLQTFQFEVKSGVKVGAKDKTLRFYSHLDLVHKDLLLPHDFIDALYRLDCSS